LIQYIVTQPSIKLNLLILEPNRLQGKSRPRGVLKNTLRETKSSTRQLPLVFELSPSIALVALSSVRRTASVSARVFIYNAQSLSD
jgi:hypothetical protein